MKKDNNSELVYSTNPHLNTHCERCKKLLSVCICQNNADFDITSIRAVLHRERAHRGGKDVTIIDHLPANESFLKDLAQTLKKRCGTGGTYKINGQYGSIEIQGDKQELLRIELGKVGIKCR